MGFSLERRNEYLTAFPVAMVHYTWLNRGSYFAGGLLAKCPSLVRVKFGSVCGTCLSAYRNSFVPRHGI